MPVLTLASIAADLEAVETAARGRGSLACDHLATRLTTIRGDLQRIAALSAPAEAQAQGGGEVVEPMTGDLLPCPFCGKSNQDRWPCEWLDDSGANVIRCAWCHGAAPTNTWKRRTPPPSAPVGVEALRAEQAAAVMPLIGPLLDAWERVHPDDSVHDSDIARYIEPINRAMQDDTEPGASYSIDADPAGIRARVADAITGALAFGAQGSHPPPSGHWLEPFWDMARAEAQAQVGGEVVAWQHPDTLPPVKAGQYGWFWVAVRRANGRIYSFPATYLNAMVLTDENCDQEENQGNRYHHGPVDEDEGTFEATGWHDAREHYEYSAVYLPLLDSDKDELIAWRSVADYGDTAPPSAPVGPHTYASTQATKCADCGEHKHTPLRIDAMGGYVCLTCIDQKLGSLLGEFGYAPSAPVEVPAAVRARRQQITGWFEGLNQAARSLRTIAEQAGRTEGMEDMQDVRGYANSRATVAESALAAQQGEAGDA